MRKYKHLFVDLDDTLFDSTSLYEDAIEMAYERLHTFHGDLHYKLFKKKFLEVRKDLKTKLSIKQSLIIEQYFSNIY
jgi:FMN phosphatase YigB (HAD superfamily)